MKKHKRSTRQGGKKPPLSSVSVLFSFFFGYLLLFLPVFYLPQVLDRTLMPRLLALGVLVLPTVLWLTRARLIRHLDFSIWRQPMFLTIAGYLLVILLTIPFASNYRESFFDLARTLAFTAGTVLSALLLANTPNWKEQLPKYVVVAAAFALIVGFVQYISKVSVNPVDVLADGRASVYAVTGLFSHKNIFSAFMALMLPFTLFGAWRYRGNWQYAAIATSALLLVLILLLRTRSIWLGIILASFAVAVLLLIFARSFHLSLRWRSLILGGMIAGAITLAGMIALGDTSDAFSVAGRLKSMTDSGSQHNIHRLNTWRSTLDMVADNPITGVGPGNWQIAITPYFLHPFEEVDQMIWHRPHNDYLWVLAEKGIAGLLMFLAIFALAAFYLLDVMYRRGKDREDTPDDSVNNMPHAGYMPDKVLALLLFAGLIIYLTDSFFSFPYERIDIQMLLFIILAASATLRHDILPKSVLVFPARRILVAGFAVSFIISVYGWEASRMETHIYESMHARDSGNYQQMLNEAILAHSPLKSLGPGQYPPEYMEGIAHDMLNQHQLALDAFLKAREQSPHDVRIINRLGLTCLKLGRLDEAREYLKKVLNHLPRSEEVRRNLATVMYELDRYPESLELLLGIPDWEQNPAIAGNVQFLKSLINQVNEK